MLCYGSSILISIVWYETLHFQIDVNFQNMHKMFQQLQLG